MAVIRAVIEKCGIPDRFEQTTVGRSMANLISEAFLEPHAMVVGRIGPRTTEKDVIAAFEKQGWQVRTLSIFPDGTGEDLIHEFRRRRHGPPPPLKDDLD